jgi:uncharacterized membrane protein
MRTLYDRLAGQGLERIGALSDGLFAFAMTVIVLEIHVPDPGRVHTEADLWRALGTLGPRFITYVLSFLTLGIFWLAQQTQLHNLKHSDRDFSWLHLTYLAFVALLPFSTSLLAEYIDYRSALLLYWANIAVLGLILYIGWDHAVAAGLVKDDAPPGIEKAIRQRIAVAQALYVLGALLCVISTFLSIGFIILVQLFFATVPHARFRRPRPA